MTVVDLSKDVVLYGCQSFSAIYSGNDASYKDVLDEVLQESNQQSAILPGLNIAAYVLHSNAFE